MNSKLKQLFLATGLVFMGCASVAPKKPDPKPSPAPKVTEAECKPYIKAAERMGYSKGLTQGIQTMRNSQKETLEGFEKLIREMKEEDEAKLDTPKADATPEEQAGTKGK